MKITFYGVRGSLPVCNREFIRYGGNTSSMLYEFDDGSLGILDAGTGIVQLGKDLIQSQRIDREVWIAFTHFHWDHIQGFPFFRPAYDPGLIIRMLAIGQERKNMDVRSLFEAQMQTAFFPVPLGKMGAKFMFEYMNYNELEWRGHQVRIQKHNHPGIAYSFRFDLPNQRSFAVCTDIEHDGGLDENILNLVEGVDVLVHDGQYTPEELVEKKGWGHSSWKQCTDLARLANVKELYITHHDPDHDDDFLDEIQRQAREEFAQTTLAREGMQIVL
jgi:phosphoribosyl 1,2-cyclic phosphodiesterase